MSQATAGRAPSRDPVEVDSKHYKVEFENDRVRVLRISYGPNEKSVMHAHPSGVAVCLSDLNGRFIFRDGTSEERRAKAGQTLWMEGEEHLPENLAGSRLEVILVELKG